MIASSFGFCPLVFNLLTLTVLTFSFSISLKLPTPPLLKMLKKTRNIYEVMLCIALNAIFLWYFGFEGNFKDISKDEICKEDI